MNLHFLNLVCFAATSIAWFGVSESLAQDVGSVEIEKKSIELKSGTLVQYELGTLFVPENRSDPESRTIGVGFARFAAEAPVAPPVFRLPGGPGGSLITRLTAARGDRLEWAVGEIRKLQHFSDVILVDQRGYSERGDILRATFQSPNITSDQPRTVDMMVAAFQTFARETVAKFATGEVDLRGYNVKECAHDVADLSKALGYDKMMLNGTSFGSQWSFAIMRLHPERVTRALLSGIEPLNSGYDMPSYVFAAVQRMWLSIEQDARFAPYLPEGGMAEAAQVVIERLEKEPLAIKGKSKGKERTVVVIGPEDFPWNEPAHILELYHGHTARWQQLALRRMLSARQPIRLIGPLIDSSLGTTPQRRHRLWTDPATRYLSRSNFAMYLATADIWPSPDVGDDFRTPIVSEIPVVFTNGSWDTQTPMENTFEIAPFFLNSRVLIADRGGHGVLEPISSQLPEVYAELLEFLRSGDMEGIPARVTLKPSRRFTPPRFPAPSR